MFIARASRQSDRASPAAPAWLAISLVLGIVFSLLAQVWLIFNHMFSADEFHFLGQVHDYLRGTLDLTLQTLHVHLFAPLAALPGSEVEQLIAGRLGMLLFEGVTLVSLYLLARTWSGTAPSLLAVLAFATMPLTLQHGASFRTDPLALVPVMAALALLARAPIRAPSIIAIGLLAAAAFLVTVKVIFFAPAFAGIAAWRFAMSKDRRRTGQGIAAIAAVAAVAAIAMYFLHQSTLPAARVARSTDMLASAGSTTILNARFLPEPRLLLLVAGTAPLQVLLILATAIGLLFRWRAAGPRDRWQIVALLGCLAPMASLLFYRNAFPYFIPTISAPAFAAVAWFVDWRRWSPAIIMMGAAGMVTTGALFVALFNMAYQTEQRTTIQAVHQIFPEPVTYLDGSSMIASFPRQGFFMSGWGMAEYRKRPPMFEQMLRQHQVPLLLLNSSAFERALGLGESRNGRLHPADSQVLRDNYIPHWGPVWVAGKHVRLGTGVAQTTILVPGRYTVEGAALLVDGRPYRPGDTLLLSRGVHRLTGSPGTEVTLRWGNHLARPSLPVPTKLSRGF